MSSLNLNDLRIGLDASLQPPATTATEGSNPKLPEDILLMIFVIFTKDNFRNLKTTVRVNLFLYNQFSPRLYRFVSLCHYEVVECAQWVRGLANNRSTSDPESATALDRTRQRLLSLCQSIEYLTIKDKTVGILIAKITSSANDLFKNVRYLSLGKGFMRFLRKIDNHGKQVRQSREVVTTLGRHLRPKHLCIDTLRPYAKKNVKPPEIWKLEIMKKDWDLDSITFHNDSGLDKVLFSNVTNQTIFHSPESHKRGYRHFNPFHPIIFTLISSTGKRFDLYPSFIKIVHDEDNYQLLLSPELENNIEREHIHSVRDGRNERCVCCNRGY
ncbi:uncharacterized protein I206_104545 [Kwoniella pini CBS 10737]|uniref:Uncharacterized protein n=1 Tax=Kwoniella pini CBS 10737 TaxID=1296096 RepID=A0A1B9I790_9TREE|nr:uncharacterized protein I206_02078 [Kwoniella pini CBS 10737]OCF51364.1 hypothetical protein I206_02078 [Kwoniella pini CBS 10737]